MIACGRSDSVNVNARRCIRMYVSTSDLNTYAVGLAASFTSTVLSLILYKTVSAVTQSECIVLSEIEHRGSLCY